MTSTITRKCATFAASAALVLSVAACSSETDGEGSPSSDKSSSAASSESDGSESSSAESSESESSESESSESAPSGDMLPNSDSTFEVAIPSGYIDAFDKVTTGNHTLAVAENDPSSAFPTTIIVESTSANGASLDEIAEAAKSNGEGASGSTASETDPPFDAIDGEEYIAYEYEPFDQGGQQLASVQAITIHDDIAYAITVNALADATSEAGSSFIELVESWTWTD